MQIRTKKNKARATARALAVCALAVLLVLPGAAAFADTLLGMRVYDSAKTPSSGEGTTALGIRVGGPVYQITWEVNGGSFPAGTSTTTSVKWGTATVAPGTPTKNGYTFQGWSSTQGGQATELPQQTKTETAKWYAVWSPITYTITYNLDSGSASNPETYTIETPQFKLNNPSRSGYTFTGWSGTGLDGEANLSVTIPIGSTGNRSYTAHWKLSEYQVTFGANGGTGTMAAQTFRHGVAQALNPNQFKRDGYDFLGWNENANATSAQYKDKESITVTKTTALHAVWKIKTYTVSFVSNGGSSVSAQTVNHGSTASRPADPTRSGYRFEGWYSDTACTQLYDFGTAVTSNKNLYAKWSIAYTIVFDKNNGTGSMSSMNMVVGKPVNLTKNTFTRTGYTFSGWNTKANGGGAAYADQASVDFTSATPGSTVTLYAQWSLVISCDVPTTAVVTIDSSGTITGQDQSFASHSVEPLKVSSVESSKLSGADSVFADQTTRNGVRVTLKPKSNASAAVQIPLATPTGGTQVGFSIPAKGTLAVSFGLALPDSANLSYLTSAAEVARLSYVIGAAS